MSSDLALDNPLKSAVMVSLFTDRVAPQQPTSDDTAVGIQSPTGPTGAATADWRGWWGDAFADRPIGSRLWQLRHAGHPARDRGHRQRSPAVAGTVLQLLIPVIVERAASNLDLAGVDAAVTKIVGGVSDLKTAIEAKPTTAAATVAPTRIEVPHPVVPGQPVR
ncbi:phage GP46 family protein [Komagataeibacter oboediens]|uniref:phage GP46 family protein n=1 Tax=Komagataeibacter oboediens TaxID=65958 RepID=UPI001F36F0B2|nr:phage GP46 family protein [Komagataeibacter oboediens]